VVWFQSFVEELMEDGLTTCKGIVSLRAGVTPRQGRDLREGSLVWLVYIGGLVGFDETVVVDVVAQVQYL
jgi:hypothetical protein